MITDIRIETDEGGFILVMETDTGGPPYYRLPAEQAEKLHKEVLREILPWLVERDEARNAVPQGYVGEGYLDLAGCALADGSFRCDPDESAGYAKDDPKHPTYHERMSEAWDSRAGK